MREFLGPFAPVGVFFTKHPEILLIVLALIIYHYATRNRRTRSKYNAHNATLFSTQVHETSSDKDFAYLHDQQRETARQIGDGIDGAGDLYWNGTPDTPLDFNNPTHAPVIDSYDPNQTQ